MKRLMTLTAAVALTLSAASAWADGLFSPCHCTEPPCNTCCKDCSDPCCHRLNMTICGPEHAECLIQTLCSSCDAHERVSAARKLGNRMHADFCACPEVLNALVKALTCDTCWEVRRHAAWAIYYQNARVPQGVAALYIASKLDRHYVVRTAATEALDMLTLCRKDCFKDLYKASDVLIARIRPDYNPTKGNCVNLVMNYCATCGGEGAAPMGEPAMAPKVAEAIAPPKEEKKDENKEEKKDENK